MDKSHKWVYIYRVVSAKGADMDIEGIIQIIFCVDKFCTRLSIQDSRPDPNSPDLTPIVLGITGNGYIRHLTINHLNSLRE